MKKLIILLIIFLLIISFLVGGLISLFLKDNSKVESENKVYLPKITLKSLEHNKIKFSEINKPTIMLFWLPQSKSCQQQLDILSTIQQKYTNQLQVLAIGIGKLKEEKIRQIINEKNLNYPILIDLKTKLTQELEITTIPTIIFYQPFNAPVTVAGLKDEKELEKLIKSHLQLNQVN